MTDFGEAEIVWLDDPQKWDYVRVLPIYMGTRARSLTNSTLKLKLANFYKLVGYATLTRETKSTPGCFFIRRVFWLKDYDRGCPNEKYHVGCPSETVDPLTVKPNMEGSKTNRCFGGGSG